MGMGNRSGRLGRFSRTSLLTSVLLTCLGCMVALRNRIGNALASDSESITWGASDPTWSPDGTQLAFSLFGSIWRVSAAGGEAQQLTSSSGYHGHPAWSPRGDKIVYVKSAKPPYHQTLNIGGKLVLLSLNDLGERAIFTEQQTAGTPTWSPDGASIACGLQAPGGAALHIIRLADGAVWPIQFAMSSQVRTTASTNTWVDAAWNFRHNEIFFGAFRMETPQIWSIPPGDRPVLIQLPLTRYKPEDVASFRGLTALRDGTSVIYSGVVVNDRGNYELYRIPREGGMPTNLTNTSSDEFSPAVSPDGKQIAYVSNALGNIDLFTMSIAGGEQNHVRITNLKFQHPSGQVHVRVLDELGHPTAARLYVRASDGKTYCPPGSPLYYFPIDVGGRPEGFFITNGDATFPAPAGDLRLVTRKGLEYRVAERTLSVTAGETTEIVISLDRWTNWYQRGWYTGENHFHANYDGSYYQRPKQSLEWLMAEDLNAANMLVANSVGGFVHDREFFHGAPDPLSNGRYILYWGQEYRNRIPFGHMCFLNLKRLVEPGFTSFPGTESPYDFPLNTMAAMEARRQGGLVVYTHPMHESADPFDSTGAAKELPVAAAFGVVDSIDLLPWGENAYELWYSTLNSGFKIAPGAGTDTFTNYRGITRLPGAARQYVDVGSGLDWSRWLNRYREGRDFVTNAPLLTFNVNGNPLGSVIKIPEGSTYRARLATEVTADIPLSSVELIQNGRVIESRTVKSETRSFRLEKEVIVHHSCWFAVRVTGDPTRGGPGLSRAHSGAIYVDVGGKPTLVEADIELMIRMIDRLWAYLEERNNFGPGDNRHKAQEMILRAKQHYLDKLQKVR